MVCKPLESTRPRTLHPAKQTWETIRRTISVRGSEEEKCGDKASLASKALLCFFFVSHAACVFFCGGPTRRLGWKAATTHSCDGHNDRGAGCLCLWSVANCDNSQPMLLPAVLFARRSNCGLFLGGECGQQTGRHGDTEVKSTTQHNTTS